MFRVQTKELTKKWPYPFLTSLFSKGFPGEDSISVDLEKEGEHAYAYRL